MINPPPSSHLVLISSHICNHQSAGDEEMSVRRNRKKSSWKNVRVFTAGWVCLLLVLSGGTGTLSALGAFLDRV